MPQEKAATLLARLLSKEISVEEFKRLAETLSNREMAILLEDLLRKLSEQQKQQKPNPS